MTENVNGKAPPGLSKAAASFYEESMEQFRFATASERAILLQAAHAMVRIEESQKEIKKTGMFIKGHRGTVAHPAVKTEMQARTQFLNACRLLGINQPVGEKNG